MSSKHSGDVAPWSRCSRKGVRACLVDEPGTKRLSMATTVEPSKWAWNMAETTLDWFKLIPCDGTWCVETTISILYSVEQLSCNIFFTYLHVHKHLEMAMAMAWFKCYIFRVKPTWSQLPHQSVGLLRSPVGGFIGKIHGLRHITVGQHQQLRFGPLRFIGSESLGLGLMSSFFTSPNYWGLNDIKWD